MNVLLWVVQIVLALLFVFAGATKLVMPIEEMTRDMPVAMPGTFFRFLGVAEVLGGLGLILPSLLRIRPWLTPLAAALLVIVMAGAVGIGLMMGGGVLTVPVLIPLAVGLLLVFVAYGRSRVLPIRETVPASHRRSA